MSCQLFQQILLKQCIIQLENASFPALVIPRALVPLPEAAPPLLSVGPLPRAQGRLQPTAAGARIQVRGKVSI